jgi:hypothetical protein
MLILKVVRMKTLNLVGKLMFGIVDAIESDLFAVCIIVSVLVMVVSSLMG